MNGSRASRTWSCMEKCAGMAKTRHLYGRIDLRCCEIAVVVRRSSRDRSPGAFCSFRRRKAKLEKLESALLRAALISRPLTFSERNLSCKAYTKLEKIGRAHV